MPLDFPTSPVTNQLYTFGGRTWKYNGDAWEIVPQATTPSSIDRTVFTATTGQTTFSVVYTPNFIQVYLNGSHLAASEYTATNGTSVILASGASALDILEVVEFDLGNYVSGLQGLQGLQGSGFQGTQGLQGLSNQGVQGLQGRQGTQGLVGSTTVTLSDDTTTNATRYLLFDDETTGTLASVNVSSTKLTFNPSTGNLIVGGTVTASSDEVIKTNIKTIENALEKVLLLRGVEYDRIDTKVRQIGVIAQEIEKIIPEVVLDGEIKSVAYGNLTAILIEAIKELNQKIDLLIKTY
jgi:hypothetical protein